MQINTAGSPFFSFLYNPPLPSGRGVPFLPGGIRLLSVMFHKVFPTKHIRIFRPGGLTCTRFGDTLLMIAVCRPAADAKNGGETAWKATRAVEQSPLFDYVPQYVFHVSRRAVSP